MVPGFIHWWREAHRSHDTCEDRGRCSPRGHRHQHRPHDTASHFGPGGEDGGGFGVRRPLRFMAWKLELDEAQVTKLAAILDGLKTERAQAAVDHRRSVGAFADALADEAFDVAAATAAAEERVQSAARLKTAVIKALEQTHAMLTPGQRQRLAYLLRSGQLTI
jgi:Spy/CpxP family protein refolding chaperone